MARPRRRDVVLDASVILAVVFDEPGGELDDAVVRRSVVSAVNATEVDAKLLERGVPDGDIDAVWDALGVEIVPCARPTASVAASLLSTYRSRGLSLGDAVCLATAHVHGLPVLTADRLWAQLPDLQMEVRQLR